MIYVEGLLNADKLSKFELLACNAVVHNLFRTMVYLRISDFTCMNVSTLFSTYYADFTHTHTIPNFIRFQQ